jgi:hypothetical protein
MANRAYLYTASKNLTNLKDVSETRSEVSLAYKILLGIETTQSDSLIWDNPHQIAIYANFELGLKRLNDFYEYLKTQEFIDFEKISEYQKTTADFFITYPERKSDLFFMEAGEAYDLVLTENWTLDKESEYTFLLIKQISSHIEEILETRPTNLFDHSEKYKWLSEIIENLDCLNPYWTSVTYFSFNKTDENKV